ncbi:MAG: sarcosine oxidase subunit gamma [Candidatus Aldehydirespiratoraceae bacterium]
MADLTLIDESSTSRVSVRAANGTPAAFALGLTFGAAEHRNNAVVARIRLDEWFVVGDTTIVDALDLAGFASRVDITHSRLQFRLTGTAAPKVLEKVCSLDFGDHMTPNGGCIGASVAKVSCDLIRDDTDGVRSYLILADTSFRDYLRDALDDAMAEFT